MSNASSVARSRHAEGTVFFIDMRNFTLLTSALNTRDDDRATDGNRSMHQRRIAYLVDTMSGFFSDWDAVMQRQVRHRRIDTYLFQATGDGVMVALEGGMHAEVACTTAAEIALRMRRTLDETVNPRLRQLGIKRSEDLLDFGIGICSGSYTYIHMNTDSGTPAAPSTHTILGSAPNYAARVESSNKDHVGTTVMIGEPTVRLLCENAGIDHQDHRLVEDSFGLRYLWAHKFRGMRPMGLYIKILDD